MHTARTFTGEEAVHDPENKQTGPGIVRSIRQNDFRKKHRVVKQDGKDKVGVSRHGLRAREVRLDYPAAKGTMD